MNLKMIAAWIYRYGRSIENSFNIKCAKIVHWRTWEKHHMYRIHSIVESDNESEIQNELLY